MKRSERRVFFIFCILLSISYTSNAAIVEDNQGLAVTERELNVYLEEGPPAAQRSLLENKRNLKQKIQDMYLTKAVAENARKEGIGSSDEDQLKLQALIDAFYVQLKMKALQTEDLPDFDPLAKVHYQANKSAYVRKEQVDTSHILISNKTRCDQEALQLAEQIREQLLQGEDFAQLAVQYSDDSSVKKNRGHLGQYEKGVMVKEYDQAAFSLQVNQFSPPVKTKYGYHIIRLNRRIAAKGYKDFEQVRPQIIAKLKNDYLQSRKENYLNKIERENNMRFDEQALDNYRDHKLKELATPADE